MLCANSTGPASTDHSLRGVFIHDGVRDRREVRLVFVLQEVGHAGAVDVAAPDQTAEGNQDLVWIAPSRRARIVGRGAVVQVAGQGIHIREGIRFEERAQFQALCPYQGVTSLSG